MTGVTPSIQSWKVNDSSEHDLKDISVSIKYPKSKRDVIPEDALCIIELLHIPDRASYSYDIEADVVSVRSPLGVVTGYNVTGYMLTIETSVRGKNPLSVVREFIRTY